MTLLPWIALIVYDAVLYIFRIIAYEIPVIGGRARDRPPPGAPSLSERPDGRRRVLSVSLPGLGASAQEAAVESIDGLKRRLVDGQTDYPNHSSNHVLGDDRE